MYSELGDCLVKFDNTFYNVYAQVVKLKSPQNTKGLEE